MKEEWRVVEDFPMYKVSNTGKVQSKWKGGKWKPMALTLHSSGCYLEIKLVKGKGVRKGYLVHRLVAEVFIPNPGNKPYVRHLDGNPANNTVNNLSWGTAQENEDDKFLHGSWDRRGPKKLNWNKVAEIRKMYSTGNYTQAKLGEMYGVSFQTISEIVLFRTWNKQAIKISQ